MPYCRAGGYFWGSENSNFEHVGLLVSLGAYFWPPGPLLGPVISRLLAPPGVHSWPPGASCGSFWLLLAAPGHHFGSPEASSSFLAAWFLFGVSSRLLKLILPPPSSRPNSRKHFSKTLVKRSFETALSQGREARVLGGRFWRARACWIRPPSITEQLAVVSAAFQAVLCSSAFAVASLTYTHRLNAV